MGNQKQKWTAEEEEALNRGVQKYGTGKWKNILKDPEFAPFLTSRSNIDLKDKWRNLSVSNGQGSSKDKSRTPKTKGITAAASTSATPATPAPQSQSVDDPSQNAEDVKNPPRYTAMVFEALSSIKDTNGCDINAIVSFIEQKHKVPQNFRRALGTRLRRLVSQGKLEKVQNCYRIKKDAPSGTKSPAPRSPSPKPKDVSSLLASNEKVREAAEAAAYRVADAENKAYLAAEAAKEVERLTGLVEDNEAVLQYVTDIYERCLRGEVVLLG